MSKHQLPLTTKVIITESPHQGVNIGDEGFIDAYKDDGYAVSIKKHYYTAVPTAKGNVEERVWFFKQDQVKEKIIQ